MSSELKKWIEPRRVQKDSFTSRGLGIIAKDLIKIYKIGRGIEVQALRGVSLKVSPGEAVCIMGPSGSGKTTLLNMIGGVDYPTGGQVIVGNIVVNELPESLLEKYRLGVIGYMFQAFNLIPVLSALENIAVPMIAFGVPREIRAARAKWLLEQVGLSHRAHHKPAELSGGEQQRVAIAVALANDPPVILADEPTAELDTENALRIIDLLVGLSRKHGKTIIVSTHDPRIAVRTDRILRLEDGKVKGTYRPTDLGLGVMEAGKGVDVAEVLKNKLASTEKELEELVARYARREIGFEEFDHEYNRLRTIIHGIRELLSSMGH